MRINSTARYDAYRYLGLTVAVLLVALAGSSIFALYLRITLPTMAGSSLLLLAVVTGVASLFSPCSFPLLVTLLARATNGRSRSALYRFALAFTMGVTLFLLLLGLVTGQAPDHYQPAPDSVQW